MPGKFVLIDHSIKDGGGHHLEYARRVLVQAQQLGLETVIGTNRQLTSQILDSFTQQETQPRLIPVFRYTFWENQAGAQVRRQTYRAVKRMARLVLSNLNRLQQRFRYSRVGLAAFRARDISSVFDAQFSLFADKLGSRHSSSFTVAFFWIMTRFFRQAKKAWARLARTAPVRGTRFRRILVGPTRILVRVLRALLYLIAGVFALLLFPLIGFLVGSPLTNKRSQFRRDLWNFVRCAHLSAGDVVFIPTLGDVELLALADLISRKQLAQSLKWRLLFRRNIYHGWPSAYSQQNDFIKLRRLRLIGLRIKQRCAGVDIRFFTDTGQLTAQYNLMRIIPFETAPIPVDPSLGDIPLEAKRKLCIGYFGDARDEKGYQLIAPTIDLVHRHIGDRHAPRFLVQTNFNVPGGESAALAGALQLQSLPEDWRTLVKGPLDTDRFLGLFRKTDAVLLPYDPVKYAARSSGLFAEALVAGRPPIVTHGTWMAGVMEFYRQAYLAWVEDAVCRPSGMDFVTKFRRSHSEQTRDMLYNVQVPPSTHLLVRVTCREPIPDEFLVLDLSMVERDGKILGQQSHAIRLVSSTSRLLVRLAAGTSHISLAIHNISSTITTVPEEVVIYAVRPPSSLALSFCAPICAPTAEALAAAIEDLVLNYDSYRRMAAALRPAWTALCHPRALVAQLTQVTQDDRFQPNFETLASEAVGSFVANEQNLTRHLQFLPVESPTAAQ